jgi:hypothetical protein
MLTGTLDDFTLPDVFRLMSFAKKTGRLDVVRSAGAGKVFFRDGEVYFAESSLSKEPLGQKLVRARALTDGQLMKALDQHAASGERLGTVLIQSGLVTEEQLLAALHQQIEDSIFDLLRWELGEFAWEPGDHRDVEVPISVSVENLIMEASRRLDELEVIKRKIPSGTAVLGMAATPPEGAVEINITPDEWRILVLVDGSRSVNDIAQMVGLDEFGAMRVLYGLVSAGLIELISEGSDAPAQVVPAAPEPAVEVAVAPPVIVPEEPVAEVEASVEPEAPAEEQIAEVAPEEPVEAEAAPVEPVAADVASDIFEAIATEDDAAVVTDEEVAFPAGDDTVAATVGDETVDDDALAAFGIEPLNDDATPVAASIDDAAWDEPATIESFDAPQPDELVTQTPPADPFIDGLMSAPASTADEPPAPPAPAEEEIPASSAPSGEAPAVDRAAVVRELAGLFDDDEQRPRPRPLAPRAPGEEGEDTRKRVEDDDQVTKGIISRLIDGVKGL